MCKKLNIRGTKINSVVNRLKQLIILCNGISNYEFEEQDLKDLMLQFFPKEMVDIVISIQTLITLNEKTIIKIFTEEHKKLIPLEKEYLCRINRLFEYLCSRDVEKMQLLKAIIKIGLMDHSSLRQTLKKLKIPLDKTQIYSLFLGNCDNLPIDVILEKIGLDVSFGNAL